ncbi:hypothetical protein KI387_014802, partial [Taxus chinensis]
MQSRMDSVEGRGGGVTVNTMATVPPYNLLRLQHTFEDIILCIDTDRQMETEMKSMGAKGQALTRMDSVKQAILLFVHAKLAINPNHRFTLASLGHSATWRLREFTNDIGKIRVAVTGLAADALYLRSDLTHLFKMAATEAKSSRAQCRTLRVVLIYCRSSIVPDYPSHWPESQRLFCLDVLYLHDKPSRDNCPQKVYDALVDALECVSEHEGYIFENGAGLTRVLFQLTCILLSHPQQRCPQDDIKIPKSLKKPPPSDAIPGSASSQKES